MISTICDSRMMNTGRKDRSTNQEIKKPYCVVQCDKLMNDVDRADQYLSYYSILKKTVKWSKKMVVYLIHCTLFNAILVCKTLNRNRKTKYTNFLHELARSWIAETKSPTESSFVNWSSRKGAYTKGA
jgi:hypothetical protein